MAKKDEEKNKAKDLSQIKYDIYRQKDHYVNKYPKKRKTL